MFYLIPVSGYDEYEIDDFGQACVLENIIWRQILCHNSVFQSDPSTKSTIRVYYSSVTRCYRQNLYATDPRHWVYATNTDILYATITSCK